MQTLMPNSQTNVEEKKQKQEDYPTIALDLILEKWDLRIQAYIMYFVKMRLVQSYVGWKTSPQIVAQI